MNKLIIFATCLTFLALTTSLAQSIVKNSQSSSVEVQSDNANIQESTFIEVQSDSSSDMNRSSSFMSQHSSSDGSFGYQQSSLTLSAANLNRPHILSINTAGAQMSGEILVDDKVVKQINNSSSVDIDLSRHLSAGEHKVDVSARYSPASSAVSVELSSPSANITQQNNGNGVLNYTMNVSVR
ncbi:MAG: hypothetical protein SAK29_25960 [Scytonema sp. PMC 1069.18]|nr:hypothetical protein [Scytonema sp. PMC 1069.18]MEC4882637.1 hypothetical protein [Scytonema sp. PMC 1070.18]